MLSSSLIIPKSMTSEWAFPFEGNWNLVSAITHLRKSSQEVVLWMSLPVWRELKLKLACSGVCNLFRSVICLNEPSRLKGIETFGTVSFAIVAEQWPSEWAFPFEGNWNSNTSIITASKILPIALWMSLPVWRELKLYINDALAVCYVNALYVWMSLPVWRELKHSTICESDVIPIDFNSEWAFPFEGNWNISTICQTYRFRHRVFLWMSLPVWRELKQLRCRGASGNLWL